MGSVRESLQKPTQDRHSHPFLHQLPRAASVELAGRKWQSNRLFLTRSDWGPEPITGNKYWYVQREKKNDPPVLNSWVRVEFAHHCGTFNSIYTEQNPSTETYMYNDCYTTEPIGLSYFYIGNRILQQEKKNGMYTSQRHSGLHTSIKSFEHNFFVFII